jgi:plasmid maintenance system antidote protein VapI
MNGLDILVARRKLNLNQWQLASFIGIHPARLSEIERGRRPLTSELEAKIKMILDELNKKGGKYEHSTRPSQ